MDFFCVGSLGRKDLLLMTKVSHYLWGSTVRMECRLFRLGGWGGRVANDGTTTAERRGLTPGVSVGWRGGWRPLQVAGAA